MQVTNDKGESLDVESLPMPSLVGHRWKQYGNKLECQSCPTLHAAFLQPGFYISGYKDGIPVISRLASPSPDPFLAGDSVSVPDQPSDT